MTGKEHWAPVEPSEEPLSRLSANVNWVACLIPDSSATHDHDSSNRLAPEEDQPCCCP